MTADVEALVALSLLSIAIATRSNGSISGQLPFAQYGFDDRMQYVRPPSYPLLVNDWSYEDWTELPLPAWALP